MKIERLYPGQRAGGTDGADGFQHVYSHDGNGECPGGNGAYIYETGTTSSSGGTTIPASDLSPSKSLSNVKISGGFWVESSSNLMTPVVVHPVIPIPKTFNHKWTAPKK
ncbi:hypothetical protein COR50_21775 [Chitinophaga caeni]|uniref:Uncharacterized protein n=1 Tax=Chitinophaga caeni TaxID=2029983 RepID=A0A291R0C4_9BACT|nr:hypothetical protein COR50_21775 [Chitinophaga caeni]